jgi:hypothetical protein
MSYCFEAFSFKMYYNVVSLFRLWGSREKYCGCVHYVSDHVIQEGTVPCGLFNSSLPRPVRGTEKDTSFSWWSCMMQTSRSVFLQRKDIVVLSFEPHHPFRSQLWHYASYCLYEDHILAPRDWKCTSYVSWSSRQVVGGDHAFKRDLHRQLTSNELMCIWFHFSYSHAVSNSSSSNCHYSLDYSRKYQEHANIYCEMWQASF